jgi:hypothetical protein
LASRHDHEVIRQAAEGYGFQRLTPADAPLIDAENLFRQPGPPLPGVGAVHHINCDRCTAAKSPAC